MRREPYLTRTKEKEREKGGGGRGAERAAASLTLLLQRRPRASRHISAISSLCAPTNFTGIAGGFCITRLFPSFREFGRVNGERPKFPLNFRGATSAAEISARNQPVLGGINRVAETAKRKRTSRLNRSRPSGAKGLRGRIFLPRTFPAGELSSSPFSSREGGPSGDINNRARSCSSAAVGRSLSRTPPHYFRSPVFLAFRR